MTTWEAELITAMEINGEALSDIVESTLSIADMKKEFNDGYGRIEGPRSLFGRRRILIFRSAMTVLSG